MLKRIINIIITLVIGAIIYYFTLPALNLNNFGFYAFIAFLIMIFAILETINQENKIELFRKKILINQANYQKTFFICSGIVISMFIYVYYI